MPATGGSGGVWGSIWSQMGGVGAPEYVVTVTGSKEGLGVCSQRSHSS